MLHLKNTRYTPENSREVVYKARDLASDMNASIRVARIAKKFVELDVSVEKNELNMLIEKLAPIGPVDNIRHVYEEDIDKEQGITDGVFISIMNDFGKVMNLLKVFGKNVLGVKKNLFKELF